MTPLRQRCLTDDHCCFDAGFISLLSFAIPFKLCRRPRALHGVKLRSHCSGCWTSVDHVHAPIKLRLKELAEEQRRSITFDNGTEFARCQRLEKHLGLQLYFADPGCPHQRGTNENTNGLIRQYFPKGTDFHTVSHQEVREVENLLNNRPRACLQFETPADVFHRENTKLNCD